MIIGDPQHLIRPLQNRRMQLVHTIVQIHNNQIILSAAAYELHDSKRILSAERKSVLHIRTGSQIIRLKQRVSLAMLQEPFCGILLLDLPFIEQL
ncbi:hypothetical protein D3C78_1016890 [compost metagenome]